LSDFVTTAGAGKKDARDPLPSRIFEGTEQSLEQTRWWQRFKEILKLAEVNIPPVQLLVGTLILTLFVAWFMATFVSGILALVGLAVPLFVRGLILYRVEKRRRAFADQLATTSTSWRRGCRPGTALSAAYPWSSKTQPSPRAPSFSV
jgi:Flp pilus assembly protein TadB